MSLRRYLKKLSYLNLVGLMVLNSGCVTILSKSLSSFETKVTSENSRLVRVEEKGLGVMRLTKPSFHLIDKLRNECKDELLHGIETELSMREFILVQSYDSIAVGHCTKK